MNRGGKQWFEARHALGLEKRLQFPRRAGQKNDNASARLVFGRHELAGSARLGIAQHLRALDDIGLAGVVGRHLNAARGETGIERGQNVGIAPQADPERFRHALAREVVFGRPKSAGADQNLGARQRLLEYALNQAFTMVADHAFEYNFDAQVVKLLGKKKGVRVLAVRRQHLGADRNDLCVHSKQCSKGNRGQGVVIRKQNF